MSIFGNFLQHKLLDCAKPWPLFKSFYSLKVPYCLRRQRVWNSAFKPPSLRCLDVVIIKKMMAQRTHICNTSGISGRGPEDADCLKNHSQKLSCSCFISQSVARRSNERLRGCLQFATSTFYQQCNFLRMKHSFPLVFFG